MIEADLIAKARARRAFSVDLGEGRVLHALLPSHFDLEMAYARNSGEPTASARLAGAYREIVAAALTGWQGVRVADLIGGDSPELADFSAALVPVLLDARPAWATRLREEIDGRIAARAEAEDAARKN
jgi:hypothetical protein